MRYDSFAAGTAAGTKEFNDYASALAFAKATNGTVIGLYDESGDLGYAELWPNPEPGHRPPGGSKSSRQYKYTAPAAFARKSSSSQTRRARTTELVGPRRADGSYYADKPSGRAGRSSSAAGYCSKCRGPHVYKHGRP